MGVTVIDNTKPKSPKFRYEDWYKKWGLKGGATIQDKERYFDREHQRWVEGFSELTGYHYFSLTQCKFKNARGAEFRPWWRDIDEDDFYEPYKLANTTGKVSDLMIVKRREAALSSVFWGVIPIVNSLIYPGSQNLLTSADKDRIKDSFLNKTTVTYDNLDAIFKPARASSKQDGYMFLAKKDTRTGEYSGLKSMIVAKETVDNPKSFETYRATSIFIDEIFLHPRSDQVLSSAQACLNDGFSKVAPVVLGGSCGDATKEGAKLGKDLWYDSKDLDLLTVFIPGWKGISKADELDASGQKTGKILNFCVNGHSDQKAATEWIEKTRDRLSKAKNKKLYNTFMASYPLTIEEVFDANVIPLFPPEVYEGVRKQKVIIRGTANPYPEKRYDLIRENNGVTAKANPATGKFVIIEHPIKGTPYLSGLDPIPFNTDSMDGDMSDQLIGIKNCLSNMYVAYFGERSLNSDMVVESGVLLQDYYGGAQTMIERNHGGVTIKTYKDLDKKHLMAREPSFLGMRATTEKKNTGSYGYFRNNFTGEKSMDFVIKYLLANINKCFLSRQLEEIEDFGKGNTDFISMMEACEVLYNDIQKKKDRGLGVGKAPRKIRLIQKDQYGRTEVVWKEMFVKLD